QKVPPWRIYDARRHAIHPQRAKLRGENGHEHGHGGVRRGDADCPGRSGVSRYGGNECDAAVLAEKRKTRLSRREVRIDFLLKAPSDIGDADGSEGPQSL